MKIVNLDEVIGVHLTPSDVHLAEKFSENRKKVDLKSAFKSRFENPKTQSPYPFGTGGV